MWLHSHWKASPVLEILWLEKSTEKWLPNQFDSTSQQACSACVNALKQLSLQTKKKKKRLKPDAQSKEAQGEHTTTKLKGRISTSTGSFHDSVVGSVESQNIVAASFKGYSQSSVRPG